MTIYYLYVLMQECLPEKPAALPSPGNKLAPAKDLEKDSYAAPISNTH